MRTKQFEVPKEIIRRFFTAVESRGLPIDLIEVNEDEELVVEIGYDKNDREAMMDLIDLLDDYHEENEEENEEEEEEEDEDED